MAEHNFPQAIEERILCIGVVNNKCLCNTPLPAIVINKCGDHFPQQHRESKFDDITGGSRAECVRQKRVRRATRASLFYRDLQLQNIFHASIKNLRADDYLLLINLVLNSLQARHSLD